MILVVGGIGSGKRSYARSLGYAPADMSSDVGDGCPVLLDAQDLVRDATVDVPELATRVTATKQVVLCQEVGSGIVPIDADERAWRERVGALSRELASRADAVVRMSCGIPQHLKGASDGAQTSAKDGASFFSNRGCKYFPCHEGIAEEDFNCLFCYCPLYALGPDCGGNFTYTDKGRKNCKNCGIPHVRDNGVKLVADHYAQLAELARRARI